MTLLLRALLVICAVTLAIVAGYNNGAFWWLVMAPVSREAQIGFLVVSIACGAIKTLIPAYVVTVQVPWRDVSRAALAAFAVAILFDVTSGLGYAGLTRAAATAGQHEANRRYADALAARDAAAAELARMPEPSRSLDRIKADIAAETAKAGGCADRRARLPICAAALRLNGEAADVSAHDQAREALRVAEQILSTVPLPKDPDPHLAAIGKALEMFGVAVARDRLEAGWGLLMLLLLEFGAFPLLAFALAPQAIRDEPAPSAPAEPAPSAPTPEQLAPMALLESYPVDASGWISAPLSKIQAATGRSAASVSRDVGALVASGKLLRMTKGKGTRLRVVK